jgi:pimeloyl-ACP methyl ester carboxylesterase
LPKRSARFAEQNARAHAEAALIDVPGPWTHRYVSANGARFHVAEIGSGPLVLLLHGFPEYWWAWRHQLPALADAGYRAVAMDLRGFGGSDKTPRGYDPYTSAADVSGVIRALGEPRATVVGHGWGGFVAWSTAVLQALHVSRLAVISAPHPLRLRGIARLRAPRAWLRSLSFQVPVLPERRLLANGGAEVEHLLRAWSRPGWPDSEAAARYRQAIMLWPAPHCALEYQRWLGRSMLRNDGRRYATRMRAPVGAPVLQAHGTIDRATPIATARGSDQYVSGPYRWCELDAVGHFPHEEAPVALTRVLLDWLDDTRGWASPPH